MTMPHEKSIAIPNDFEFQTAGPYTMGADIALPDNCRGLLVGVAGVQDVTMANDEDRDLVPLVAGINPGRFKALRSDASNTAENIWAIV